jgi:two-component system sensor histidine kinase KdpD
VLSRVNRLERPTLPPPRRILTLVAVMAPALVLATIVVGALESGLGLADASPAYFVAIALVGSLLGTWPAVFSAIAAFLTYDLLFTEPRLTVVVTDAREWLDLVVFLVVAVIVGRLSALGTERAAEATRRARESSSLFAISRVLATEAGIDSAAPLVAERLAEDGPFERVWILRDRRGASAPAFLADTRSGTPLPTSSFVTTLVRTPGDAPARWVVAHEPSPRDSGGGRGGRPASSSTSGRGGPPASSSTSPARILRVRMEADGIGVGAVKALLPAAAPDPDRVATRLLALAADQLALAIRRDDLRREATEVEIARRADSLKSALLDAVSHDLRTPLASIRAAAGSLVDPDVDVSEASTRAAAAAIDVEADRLDRLVREVLDVSRIEAGSLRVDVEPLVLADAVTAVVDRLRPLLGERPIRVDVPDELPPVRADAVLLDGLLTNLIENVARHAPAPAPLAISATAERDRVRLVVDDGGPGVTGVARERLFAKFQPLPSTSQGSRPGLGLGLAIVRGMSEAMGGTVAAAESPLGGLQIVVDLPAARSAPAEAEQPTAPGGAAARR